jgi:hypothetical protein
MSRSVLRPEHVQQLNDLRAWARKQGGTRKATVTRIFKMPHTCEKAPENFRRPGQCMECAYEARVKANMTGRFGPPVKKS